jgi:hypothetical protein
MLLQNATLLMLYTVDCITSVAHSDSALLVCCASTAASGDSSASDAPAKTSVNTSAPANNSSSNSSSPSDSVSSTSSTNSSSASVWCTAGITQSALPLLDTLRSLQRCGTTVMRLQLYLNPLLNAALHIVNSSDSATTVTASATVSSANDDSGDGKCIAFSAAVQQVLSEQQSSCAYGVYSVWEELSGAATAARVQVLLSSLHSVVVHYVLLSPSEAVVDASQCINLVVHHIMQLCAYTVFVVRIVLLHEAPKLSCVTGSEVLVVVVCVHSRVCAINAAC